MKNLKLSSKNFFIFFVIVLVFTYNKLYSTETIDIWNLEKNEDEKGIVQNSIDENENLKKKFIR